MPVTPHRTFRDPAGSLELRPDGAYRTVAALHAPAARRFLQHPLTTSLVAEQRLIATEILAEPAQTDSAPAPLLLRHPLVRFISYPCEWSPRLWLAAAELTLGLVLDLLDEGWTLKDATPLNVLFEGTRPVLVDVLSIEPAQPGRSVWLAYGQFVRTFTLPLLAYARLGWPLHAVLMRRDGYEPEEVYASLSWAQRLRQPALSAVTLPALLAGRAAAATAGTPKQAAADPELTRHVLRGTFLGLRRQIERLVPKARASTWSHYASTAVHYSDEDHAAKRAFVTAELAAAAPSRVLDVGCNTGVYSRLAADAGASVVSIDTDVEAVDRLAASLEGSGLPILPLCVDLAHPTPATGWQNREQASFLTRCEGAFDLVLMLAVIHHLLLGAQVPLDRIATLCAALTTRSLILEWVPPGDPKFRQLLRGRDAIYAHLTEEAFRLAFSAHFTIARETTLVNGRILFHLQRKAA